MTLSHAIRNLRLVPTAGMCAAVAIEFGLSVGYSRINRRPFFTLRDTRTNECFATGTKARAIAKHIERVVREQGRTDSQGHGVPNTGSSK